MIDFLTESLTFSYAQVMHIVRMMYWVWVPGFLMSAFLSLRYRTTAREALLARGKSVSLSAFLAAAWYGVTASPHPRRTVDDAERLVASGVAPAAAMASLVASRNLPLYLLALLTLHLGIEFTVGHVVATVVMAGLVYAGVSAVLPPAPPPDRQAFAAAPTDRAQADLPPSWRGLLLRRRGWRRVLQYVWREFQWFWPGLALGLLVGGFVLAAGLTRWWVELAAVGGGGVLTDLLNAALAPLVGAVLALPPVGNLPVATALFKTDSFAYPGFVAFVLATSLRLSDWRAYRRLWGTRGALRLVAVVYGAAVLGALAPVAVFALFGFRPGHIPLFRELVDEIIRWVPFAMPAGGMGM